MCGYLSRRSVALRSGSGSGLRLGLQPKERCQGAAVGAASPRPAWGLLVRGSSRTGAAVGAAKGDNGAAARVERGLEAREERGVVGEHLRVRVRVT
eukprot:scaffold12224_cov45-Phaeocystis_antarctica.AAC.1